MPLSDDQIDRYSRQIIVPGIGGVAQERLLAAKLILAGARTDLEPVLAYLVGAGVGTIALEIADSGATAPLDPLIASMRALNPDVTVLRTADRPSHPDLVAILIGSRGAADAAARLADAHPGARFVIARLDAPATLAVLGASPPPCPRCADGGALLRPFATRASNAAFIAMMTAAESLKLLAAARANRSALIEFDGYRTRARPMRPPAETRCSCRQAAGAHRTPRRKRTSRTPPSA
jgi:hypothetical protein